MTVIRLMSATCGVTGLSKKGVEVMGSLPKTRKKRAKWPRRINEASYEAPEGI